jgi:hypothetical protein
VTAVHPAVKSSRLHAIEGAIKDGLGSITKLYSEVVRDRLYEADGFASAQEWASQRIGPKWIALFPVETRKEIHVEMRAEGKSTRAIAEVTGVHHSTVADDVAGVGNPTPERTTGKDGKSYPAEGRIVALGRAALVDRKPSGRPWGNAANTQIHRVLESLSSFVTGVEQLIDGVNADAEPTAAELQTIDEAIKALRQLRKKLTQTA